MTRKDFELIAASLKATKPGNPDAKDAVWQWEAGVAHLAEALKGTNQHFDVARFLVAAGVK